MSGITFSGFEVASATMTYATNALDGRHIYFEDEGGHGAPVVIHGGFLDPIELVRASPLARSLEPHRVEDAISVLRRLGLDRAHFVGTSWGGRLGFGIGEHAPDRVLPLVMIGQQPYAIDPEAPLTRLVGKALAHSRTEGIEPLVEAFESIVGRYPEPFRSIY
jgi:pimeloyl-ACP methyl ester carboxylesterase